MNVLTIGTFDILHYGHIELFKKCKQLSGDDKFVVGLNTGDFIEKYKGKAPIMTYGERFKSIDVLGMCDLILPNDQKDGTCKDLILDSKCKLIVIGSDWLRKDYLKQIGVEIEWLEKFGISLCYVPYTFNISTTELKNRITRQ
jgi:cytidyltransferase-like protein